MPSQQVINYAEFDRITLWTTVALILTGWLMIHSANYKAGEAWAIFDLSHNAGKQLLFIIICTGIFFLVQLIDWTFWRTFAWVFYGIGLLLLVGVLIFGKKINGATAWYGIGGFSFQPSEFVKFATCLAMANFLSGLNINLRRSQHRLLAFGVFLLPVGLIVLQPDVGSALVFLSFFMLLYREGLDSSWYVAGTAAAAVVILALVFEPIQVATGLVVGLNAWFISRLKMPRRWWIGWAVLLAITFFWKPIWGLLDSFSEKNLWADWHLENAWLPLHALLLGLLFNLNYVKKNAQQQRPAVVAMVLLVIGSGMAFGANYFCFEILQPHQQERIKVWLRPQECNPRGSLYNLLQSKMAIGSGGFSGKGYLDGNMTKLRYVPEQSTDFIFCTVGEEQGFIGIVAVIGLFTLLLWRITVVAERQRSDFSRRYAWCVAGILFVHFIINIGMTMGLFPIIGIPLPFISYGGSSLIGFTLMMAVLLKLDSHRFSA